MLLGKSIDNLIKSNIQNWHYDTQLKDINGELRKDLKLSDKEIGEIFLKARISNRSRSEHKEEINDFFNQGTGETKVNYYGGEK